VHDEFLKEPLTLPAYHPDTPEIRSNWVEYYHKITKLDAEFGAILDRLDRDGLADDTIVFYYSDHGGILPRSKRFVYDSGLHVPFIIRFGKNVQHLAPAPPGTAIDRLISFIDIPPTLLSIAGLATPRHFQGQAFLGPRAAAEPRRYIFGFRGRMDERYDLSYTIRDARYRYIRNYFPHRIYGQHLDYLWKMPATASWEKEFLAGHCNEIQSAFWKPKPTEELYDEQEDRWEVKNLAADPAHRQILDGLRDALDAQLRENCDAGFLPESDMIARAKSGPIYAMTHDDARYPYERIKRAADVASQRDAASLPLLLEWTKDSDPAVRYWAAVGCSVRAAASLEGIAPTAVPALRPLLADNSPAVRVAAAEALSWLGHAPEGLASLVDALDSPNSDTLLALNALAGLGDLAKPATAAIADKVKKGLPGDARMNGESGEKYTDRAAADLLTALQRDPAR
jgi:hypothetical protein